MGQLREVQAQHAEWLAANFPRQTPMFPAAGCVEEAGELMHCLVKMAQAEVWGEEGRYAGKHWGRELVDAVGDCAIYGVSLCNVNGWDFEGLVTRTPFESQPPLTVELAAGLIIAAAGLVLNQTSEAHLETYLSALLTVSSAARVSFHDATLVTWREVRARDRKQRRSKVVCLCGSTRFRTAFEEANKRETLAGNIVLTVGGFQHSGDEFTAEEKAALDALHLQKIAMADEVVLVAPVGIVCGQCGKPSRLYTEAAQDTACCRSRLWTTERYVGESTKRELAYAEKLGKAVR